MSRYLLSLMGVVPEVKHEEMPLSLVAVNKAQCMLVQMQLVVLVVVDVL